MVTIKKWNMKIVSIPFYTEYVHNFNNAKRQRNLKAHPCHVVFPLWRFPEDALPRDDLGPRTDRHGEELKGRGPDQGQAKFCRWWVRVLELGNPTKNGGFHQQKKGLDPNQTHDME